MKTISIKINYSTTWGQNLLVVYSSLKNREWKKEESKKLSYINDSTWGAKLYLPKQISQIKIKFQLVQGDLIIKSEYGAPHEIQLPDEDCYINCLWQEKPKQAYFYTSIFTNSIFHHKTEELTNRNKAIQLVVSCVHVQSSQELIIIGNTQILGNWKGASALALSPIAYGKWAISFDDIKLLNNTEYKFAIREKINNEIVEWEDGENRIFHHINTLSITELQYEKSWIDWKASGVAIPVFSLRSKKSSGIGEFSDLKLLVDWAKKTRLRIIQILPINDTTATYSWFDSYPYNTITIYALHPIYLSLHQFPLKNKNRNSKYQEAAKRLNNITEVDYTEVIKMKMEYIEDLFSEIGEDTLKEKQYEEFYRSNEKWLFSYASFCYLRDRYKTTNMSEWGEFAKYDLAKLTTHIKKNAEARLAIDKVYFIQFLLHQQLTEVKEYAYKNGVVLKGDIPIGISPNSVEAWTEPHLFNLDTQTGAPPDDFAQDGQNWGFPTYNWNEMKKTNYSWWTSRFNKMTDYFDTYRIDHILGFFRIWEIPKTSVHGLLGYFSPALPLSSDEIKAWGIPFDEQQMTIAWIHQDDLQNIFEEYTVEVKEQFLHLVDEYYMLRFEFDNQKKIQKAFAGKGDDRNNIIRNGLYEICNEVLFVRDKYDSSKYHPRISTNKTLKYNRLETYVKQSLININQDYFYHRHTNFWKKEALSKLPTLIESTNMLVCGEDLGMVPESVPNVMQELEILSLEIQRMPKNLGVKYSDLATLPYLSVTTTSTHDMSPIRMWWEENEENTQEYYNKTLKMSGEAPKECNTAICLQIVKEHLDSSAMLTILPLQDWLSISEDLRREQANEERINQPSNSHHNWSYRMHITLEELNKEKQLVKTIRLLNKESGR